MHTADSSPFQTAAVIRGLLTAAGRHPRKRYGQNFLIDRNLMMKLVDSAELDRDVVALEVGAGTGSLTCLLAMHAGAVHSFEVDPDLAAIATAQTAGFGCARVHLCDALSGQTALAPELAAVLDRHIGRTRLVANLPYDAATPLIANLLLAEHPPARLCFTIQREVGERISAAVGSRDYGPISVICQWLCRVERLALLPPRAFWPAPKVESALLRLTPRTPLPDAAERRAVGDLVRRMFLHRRKTLSHLLGAELGAERAAGLLTRLDIAPRARPEVLDPPTWRALVAGII